MQSTLSAIMRAGFILWQKFNSNLATGSVKLPVVFDFMVVVFGYKRYRALVTKKMPQLRRKIEKYCVSLI